MSPPSREDESFHFEGFDNPTTTPVPDVVFDRLVAHLGEAELKALLYVIRRTFGFKKDRDPILRAVRACRSSRNRSRQARRVLISRSFVPAPTTLKAIGMLISTLHRSATSKTNERMWPLWMNPNAIE